MKKEPTEVLVAEKDVDGGWAWVVLAGAFIIRLILGGLIWTVSAYFVIFHEEFGESRSYTAVIGSVTIAILHAAGPVSTFLIQRYGTRFTSILGSVILALNFAVNTQANGVVFLILTHGSLFGMGLCLINNASLVALSHYFDRYVYIATGSSLAGSGIGIFLFAFLVPHLLKLFGWRGALLILAGCALQVCVCSAVIFPLKHVESKKLAQKSMQQDSRRFHQLRQLCSSAPYWCMNLSFLFLIASFTIVTVLYKDFAISRGLGDYFSWILAAYGAGDITGRVLAGLVAQKCNVCIQTVVTHLLASLVILGHLLVWDGVILSVCGFLVGAVVGAQVALLCMIPAAVFGRDMFVIVIGYVQTTAGLGALVGPPVAGLIADKTDSYDWSFAFAAATDAAAAVLILVIYLLEKRQNRTITPSVLPMMALEKTRLHVENNAGEGESPKSTLLVTQTQNGPQ